METHNIISTPDVTGNIGSCTTQAEQVIVKSSLFRDTGYTIATNSCTGVVEKYDYNSINGPSIFIFGLFILFVMFLVFLLGSK